MYQRILVPTDGSPVATVAAQAAIELAKAFGSEIVALSVAQPEPAVPLAEGAGLIAGPTPEALMEEAASTSNGSSTRRPGRASSAPL